MMPPNTISKKRSVDRIVVYYGEESSKNVVSSSTQSGKAPLCIKHYQTFLIGERFFASISLRVI